MRLSATTLIPIVGKISKVTVLAKPATGYLSKTAQVSAQASKNHSQNSSVVRGGTNGPTPYKTKLMQHNTLGNRLGTGLKKISDTFNSQ